jgi:oligopeptidase A
MSNPLLATSGLPAFDQIRPEHVLPAVEQVLADSMAALEDLEIHLAPTWEGLMDPIDRINRRFERAWGPVAHLFGVLNSPDLRTAYETALPKVVEFGLRMRQSEPIYKTLKYIRTGKDWGNLTAAQQRIIDQRILSTELSGIGLKDEQRERFNAIEQELSKLSTEFSNHVLDSTKAWSLVITDPTDADGLPNSLRSLTAQSYNNAKNGEDPPATPENGPWRITLDFPSYGPFLQHCRNRSLREQAYRAYMTRASSGEWDNTPLASKILQLRKEKAELLGYKTFAEVSLAEKMAGSADKVLEMFETLLTAARPAGEREMIELHELALASGQSEPLEHWDVAFWAERLRERKYNFTDEELRPYFSHERVLDGLFHLLNRLFGITVVPADGQAPIWQKDVRYFLILNELGQQIAAFYYDPYSRPENKRPGAWMDDCLTRRKVDGVQQLPVAHLVCNGTPPVGDQPALMTFREVETLFHEFGHGLQHMLTTVDHPEVAGISGVEWDAVELPSQFMENWCYHRPTLLGLAKHFETGRPLPDDLYEKLVQAKTFRAGAMLLRQLTFGMTDMTLHSTFDPSGTETIFDVQRRIMERTAILPMDPQDRFLCAFSHIFSGGYSAGYYSYKWAEVLSADAFSAFEEAGLDNEEAVQTTGRLFRDTVLSLGGSQHPMEVYRAFRGREPNAEALLRHSGLA